MSFMQEAQTFWTFKNGSKNWYFAVFLIKNAKEVKRNEEIFGILYKIV